MALPHIARVPAEVNDSPFIVDSLTALLLRPLARAGSRYHLRMPTDAATAADQNLLKAVQVWAGAAEDGQVDQVDGCTMVRCAAALRAFNQVLVFHTPAALDELVASTPEYFRNVGGRFRFRIRDDLEPVADEPLLAAGLVRSGGIPCLSARTADPGRAPTIEIRPADDEETLEHHIDVVAAAFDWWRPELARVFRPPLLDAAGWHAYVGYRDGNPVTTAQLIVEGDVAGLYYVGTVEAARSQGYGEAITRHAMMEGASLGCALTTLQASPLGHPIYERLGFTRASYYRSFVGSAG